MSSKERTLDTYNNWHENNRPAITSGRWNLVDENILLHPEQDTLRGLNLITYLPLDINETIDNDLLPKLKGIVGRSGWMIPPKERHITVLDIIPHNSGAVTSELIERGDDYESVVNTVVKKLKTPVLIGLEGIFASSDGITIQGFPLDDGLAKLREELRKQITLSGLSNLEGKKYLIETAHVALIKFISPLDGQKLLEVVDELRGLPLGEFQIDEMVLNISPRYDKSRTVQVVERYVLGQHTQLSS